ncbi:5-hydroxytryptamine receptor 1B-like [Lithobates pipiens]
MDAKQGCNISSFSCNWENSSNLLNYLFLPSRTTNDSTEELKYGSRSLLHGFLGVFIIVMCITAAVGNLLVIVIIVATKHFHSVTSIFLINLAISDFLVGTGIMPLVATSVIYNKWSNHQYLCSYMGSAFVVYCTSSVLTLSAIALDRYRAIIDCFQYSTQATMKRAISTVIWIWTQAIFSGFPPLVGWGQFKYLPSTFSCSVNWAHSPTYTGFILSCSFLLPTCTMVFCYIRIVKVARDHARRIHNIECQLQKNVKGNTAFLDKISLQNVDKIIADPDTDGSQKSTDASRIPVSGCLPSKKQDIFAMYNTPGKEHNGTFRLFLVIFVFFCCWVPYIIVCILQSISSQQKGLPALVETISAWLALLNSAINPLLYALLSKRFRRALYGIKRRTFFKMIFFLQNLLAVVNYGKKSSNVQPIQLPRPQTHVNPWDNRIHVHSISMFSIASFAETGLEEEGSIPIKFNRVGSSAIWRSQVNANCSDLHHESLLFKPEPLLKQYLDIPCLPFEPLSSCPIKEENKIDSPVFVFGNITIKIKESNYVCEAES